MSRIPSSAHAKPRKSTAKQAAAQARDEALKNSTYHTARALAQAKANETGFDRGLEWNSVFHQWYDFGLPQRKNRFGHEARCEVVMCENLERCQPGHGPRA